MPVEITSQTLLESLSKKPATIADFNAEIDGWDIWQDEDGVHWLSNSFAEDYKMPALKESDLVKIACQMLVAFAHGYLTGRASLNSH